MGRFKHISPVEVCRLNEESGGLIMIDVSTVAEFEKSHVPIARCVSLEALPENLQILGIHTKDQIFIISSDGSRAKHACELLSDCGYPHVYLIDGGTHAWVAQGLAESRGRGGRS